MPSSHESIEEVTGYTNLLRSLSGLTPEIKRVLIPGCGAGDEIAHVLEVFKEVSKIVACDVDARSTEYVHNNYKEIKDRVSILTCDFSVDDPLDNEENFNLVILRHPELGMTRESHMIWRKIFTNSLNSLSEEGVLLMTTYVKHEVKTFRDLLPGGYRVLSFGRSPFFCSQEYIYKRGFTLGKDLFRMVIKKDLKYRRKKSFFHFFSS